LGGLFCLQRKVFFYPADDRIGFPLQGLMGFHKNIPGAILAGSLFKRIDCGKHFAGTNLPGGRLQFVRMPENSFRSLFSRAS
jgi:hypothetical protein